MRGGVVACGVVAGSGELPGSRVLLAMDTPVYRVPWLFGQLMMTPVYRAMVVLRLSVLVVAA